MTSPADELEHELYQTCEVAGRAGYTPTFFLKMLGESGGVGTVERLLATGEQQAQSGLARLYGLDLLEISAEAIMLKPRYLTLFNSSQRAVARSRLAEYGFSTRLGYGRG
jgi:hypothetical protein